MLNFWYDIPTDTKFTPYFGGGIGAMYGSIKSSANDGTFFVDVDDSDLVFAYQLGAGLAYDLNDSWVLTADYRYLDTGNYKVDGTVNGIKAGDVDVGGYSSHEVRAGVRYKF